MQREHLNVGFCSKQGIRSSMEDELVISLDIEVSNPLCTSGKLCLLAVFDGHGGSQCSQYCSENIQSIIIKNIQKYNDTSKVLTATCSELDDKILKTSTDDSGSTAAIVLIDKMLHKYWVANMGDTRAILISKKPTTSCKNDDFYSEQLTVEHRPDNKLERERIEKNGGFIENGSIFGILGVSRGFGDADFKKWRGNPGKKLVSCKADIKIMEFDKNDYFLMIACDGLFDVLSNEQCKNFVIGYINYKKSKNQSYNLNGLCKRLVNEAIKNRGSKDNVSVILMSINCQKKN